MNQHTGGAFGIDSNGNPTETAEMAARLAKPDMAERRGAALIRAYIERHR